MRTRTFEFLTVGSPMHDPASLRAALAPYLVSLATLGGRG